MNCFLLAHSCLLHVKEKAAGLPSWLSGKKSTWQFRVRSLIGEDPTYCRAARPVHYSYWPQFQSLRSTTTEPMWCSCWSLSALESVFRPKRSHRNERPMHHDKEWPLLTATREKPLQQQRPNIAKIKTNKIIFKSLTHLLKIKKKQ